MMRKMQAAQVEQFGQPLLLKELDIPTPRAGQILVKTEACVVCHTELHAASVDGPLEPPLPFTPGIRQQEAGAQRALGSAEMSYQSTGVRTLPRRDYSSAYGRST